jgi:hypothetical protein
MTDEEALNSIPETSKQDQLLFPAANLTEEVLCPVFLPLDERVLIVLGDEGSFVGWSDEAVVPDSGGEGE